MASPSANGRSWEIHEAQDIRTVHLMDRSVLDDENISMIGDDLFRLVNERGQKNVILDFSRVEFLDSTALAKMIALQRKLKGFKGKVVLLGVTPDIAAVFRITKLDRLLPLADTLADAHAFFGTSPTLPIPQPTNSVGLTSVTQPDAAAESAPLVGVLTADDICQIDGEGLSLGYAIRNIEASWRNGTGA